MSVSDAVDQVPKAPGRLFAETKRMDNIDLLRAVAILSVLIYHYTTRFDPSFYLAKAMPFTFKMGTYGVDLFFVVSGYCILMTLERSSSVSMFWAKRIARIQPAYVAGIILTCGVLWLADVPGRKPSIITAIGNMIWANVVPGFPMVDGAYWSLVVELKFYFWIGLISYLSHGKHLLAIWTLFCVLGAGLGMAGNLDTAGAGIFEAAAKYVLISPYAPFFLCGLLAYKARDLPLPTVGLFAAITILLVSFSPRFEDYRALGVAIAVVAFFVLQMSWLRVPKAVSYIGLISYSLYIVHQNIGYAIIRGLQPFVESVGLRIALAALLVGAIASLFYRLIETRWSKQLAGNLAALFGRFGTLIPLRKREQQPPRDSIAREW